MAAVDVSGVVLSTIELVSRELPEELKKVIRDLSGVVISSAADIVRHVPVLAAAAQKLELSGKEKLACVTDAGHQLVDAHIPAEGREAAHALIDTVFPATVRAVLDVSQGRVAIGEALKSAATEALQSPQVQAAALSLFQRCLGCLSLPRQQQTPAQVTPAAVAPSSPEPPKAE